MVVANYWFDWVGEVDGSNNVCADIRMDFHPLKLGWRQRARLVQDVFRNGKLTCVVQKSRSSNCVKVPLVSHAECFGQSNGVPLNATDMAVSDLVLRVNRECERFNRGEEYSIEFEYFASVLPRFVDWTTDKSGTGRSAAARSQG